MIRAPLSHQLAEHQTNGGLEGDGEAELDDASRHRMVAREEVVRMSDIDGLVVDDGLFDSMGTLREPRSRKRARRR